MRLTKGLHRVAAGPRKARYYKVLYPLECLPFSVVSPLLRNHLSDRYRFHGLETDFRSSWERVPVIVSRGCRLCRCSNCRESLKVLEVC